MNSDDIGGDCEDDDGDDITYVTQMEDPYSRSTVDTNWVKHSRKGSKKINPVEKLKYDIEMEDLSEGEVYDEAFDSAEGRSLPLPMDTQEVTKARRSSGNSTPKGEIINGFLKHNFKFLSICHIADQHLIFKRHSVGQDYM